LYDTDRDAGPRQIHAERALALAASIRSAIDLETVTARLSVEVQLGEAVEGFLYREPAVDVVHVMVDDHVTKLLGLASRLRQRQRQDLT
jgi:hypothetical protein